MIGPKPTNRLSRGTVPSWMKGTGPYIGKIVNHLDPEYMGSVEVEILKITESGNSEENTGYFIPCTYVSPFYGVTPRNGVTENNAFDYTQKSYGMWAIPPDTGVKVLVLFAENNYGFGYWIGCIQDKFMNFMLPGSNPATTYNNTDQNKVLPVGEYNKAIGRSGKDPTKYLKPVNNDNLNILSTQGLLEDYVRGTTTSSARREVPSMVFGISTPGPYDRQPGKPTVRYGGNFTSTNVPFSRLGGTSFVMDDGDSTLFRKGPASTSPPEYANAESGDLSGDVSIPHNELTRWRTRTGHQILMHNSEDLIYISNAKGSTWIELTSNGKIDIYSTDSVSIHSENDLNVKADRDINLEATGNFNIKAGASLALQSGQSADLKSGAGINLESSSDFNIKAGSSLNQESSSSFNLKSGSELAIQTSANFQVQAGADGIITASGSNNLKSSAHKITAAAISFNGPPASSAGGAGSASGASEALSPLRQPQHEPWNGHENLNPTQFTPDKTKAGGAASAGSLPAIIDTFRKSG